MNFSYLDEYKAKLLIVFLFEVKLQFKLLEVKLQQTSYD